MMPVKNVESLLKAAQSTVMRDKTVVEIKPPVYVIGDLHGNYLVSVISLLFFFTPQNRLEHESVHTNFNRT